MTLYGSDNKGWERFNGKFGYGDQNDCGEQLGSDTEEIAIICRMSYIKLSYTVVDFYIIRPNRTTWNQIIKGMSDSDRC